MQAVAGVNLPFSGQVAELTASDTGFVSMTQPAKSGSQPQVTKNESLFTKIFALGIAQAEKAGVDLKAATVSICDTEASEEDKSICDASAISGLILQLFVMQPSGSEDTSVTQAAIRPEDLTAVSAALQSEEKSSATVAAPQNEDEPPVIPVAIQNVEQIAAPVVSYGEISETVSAAEKNKEISQTKQAANGGRGQTETTAFQSNVTENIIRTLKSMNEDGKTGQSFGEHLSDEKKPASAEASQKNAVAGNLPSAITPTDENGVIDKSPAVEKALNQFVNDFIGAKAGSSEIQIVLEPESLGMLTISVSRTENGISAKIKSEDREVCAIITDHIQKLIQSMESKGVTVKNVDVEFGQMEQNFSFTQNSFGGRDEGSSGYTPRWEGKTVASEDAGFFDLWQVPPGSGTEMSGTVEYRV